MLEIQGLKKSFQGLEILKGVDLTIEKGDVDVILGESGSGKTTLLRCIDFLEKADEGKISIDGITAYFHTASQKKQVEIRRKMSFVFQNYGLFANKTALENVMLGLTAVRGVAKAEAKERAEEAIKKVGLLDRADHYPSQLSGGQQQRIGIARAIVTDPDIILMDEPTASLDPGLVGEVLHTIGELAAGGTTMLIVTHEIPFAQSIATNMLFMNQGVIIEKTPTKEFFEHPRREETRQFLMKSISDYSFVI